MVAILVVLRKKARPLQPASGDVGTAARPACHNHAVSITEIAGRSIVKNEG